MKRILITLLLALVATCCMRRESKTGHGLRPVKATTAVAAGYLDKEFVGLSTPDQAVNLAFKLGGQLLEIPVAKGERVGKGELLAMLDPYDVELQLAADQSAYDQAKSSLDRIERLLHHNAVSEQEAEMAKASFVRSKSTLDNSRELLKQTTLLAPFEAIIERVDVDVYQRVSAGERVMRIVSPQSTSVEFTLPESSLSLLEDSTTHFKVTFDSFPKVDFEAKLKEYARTSSDASGFPVALTIINPDPRRYDIRSGMSAIISMYSWDSDLSAVILPITAIYAPAGGGDKVWVIDSLDRVSLHPVELGGLVGKSSVIVNHGVKVGDRVVSAGLYQITGGEVVKIIE
ncbi:MAG: efflux RND transporter periplasmic adaptor subunit [Rikenellaceae bacterium]